ncbi:hypothetical protein B5K11_27005 [Rhizobium leguminosarum bv. trifolii]|uniref:hypothetical protein n=1 Tax=Rhizobium leguminosarum TaxID=384 RepID=UPI000E2F67F9|nr:hypothetical protein [Rhizobium leguminosarum]RFB87062.1 hypothetical protein B5K11_27005 [Rhizobium leguminosarum bv. trifolii]
MLVPEINSFGRESERSGSSDLNRGQESEFAISPLHPGDVIAPNFLEGSARVVTEAGKTNIKTYA